MQPLENIISNNDEDTQNAKKNNLTPYIAKEDGNLGALPTLGYYVPTGWEFVQDLPLETVDTKKGYGYGLAKQGPIVKNVVREFKSK